MEEVWKCIRAEPGYAISNMGRVKSLARTIQRSNGRKQTIRERVLKLSFDELGYPQVRFNRHTYKVHRLIGMEFMGDRPTNEVIRHLDGNPQNNHLSNLEYGTLSQNIYDCYDYRGNLRKSQKLDEHIASKIKAQLMAGIESYKLAKQYHVSQQTICDIKHNRIYRRVVAE